MSKKTIIGQRKKAIALIFEHGNELYKKIRNNPEDIQDMKDLGLDLTEKWDPPAQGTKARNKMSGKKFLDQKNKRYPYKTAGSDKPSRAGLVAAYKRACQYGDTAIAAKAKRLLKKYFNYDAGSSKS